MQKLNVVWLRNDLRLLDNAVLCSALQHAEKSAAAILVLYVATAETWVLHDMAAIKQDLLRRRVLQLKKELADVGLPMLAVEGSSYQQLPQIFSTLCQQFELNVFVQTEYELREQQRDEAVEQLILNSGGQFIRFDTQCLMPPGSVRTQQGDIYKVFTPFKRTWLARLQGVPLVFPPAHPFNPLAALRLCLAAGNTPEAITAAPVKSLSIWACASEPPINPIANNPVPMATIFVLFITINTPGFGKL